MGSICWCPNYIVEYWSQRLITLLLTVVLEPLWLLKKGSNYPNHLFTKGKSGWLSCPLQLNTWVGWWPAVAVRFKLGQEIYMSLYQENYIHCSTQVNHQDDLSSCIESSCPSLRPFHYLLFLVHQYHKEEPPRCCLPPTQTQHCFYLNL